MKIKIRKLGIGVLIAGVLLARETDAGMRAKTTVQHDSRDYSTLSLTGGGKLGWFDTFGFVESIAPSENRDNLQLPYAEVKFARKNVCGLGVAIELNKQFGKPNVFRTGVVYEPGMGLPGVKLYPFANNDVGMQVGIYGHREFIKGLYAEGFLDWNIKHGNIVAELQAGKRIRKGLYGVVEGRYSGFKMKEKTGVAAGLEWKF